MFVSLVLGKLRQEEYELKSSLVFIASSRPAYIARLCLKNKNKIQFVLMLMGMFAKSHN